MSTVFLETFQYANGNLTGKGPPDIGTGNWEVDPGGHDPLVVASHIAKGRTDGDETDNVRANPLASTSSPWWAEWIINLNGIDVNDKGMTLEFQSDTAWVALDLDASTGSIVPPPTGPTNIIIDARTNLDDSDYALYTNVDIVTVNATHAYAMRYDGYRQMTCYVDGVAIKKRQIVSMPTGLTQLWASLQAGGTLTSAIGISSISAGTGVYPVGVTTFQVNADGSGTTSPAFTAIQTAVADASVLAATGTVVLLCKGSVGTLTLDPSAFSASELDFNGLAGFQPGLINKNDTAVANIATLTILDTPGTGLAPLVTFNNIQIGNSVSTGKTIINYQPIGDASGFQVCLFNGVKWRSAVSLGSSTQNLIKLIEGSGGTSDGTIYTTQFRNCLINNETLGAQTTTQLLLISETLANVMSVGFFQSLIDISNIKGAAGCGVRLTTGAGGAVYFSFENSIVAGSSTSQLTFTFSGAGNHVTGSGLVTSDSQTNGTNLITAKLAPALFSGATIFDYYLNATSSALAIASSTSVPLDILGGTRVDPIAAGPVILQVVSSIVLSKSGADLAGAFVGVPQATKSQWASDGVTWHDTDTATTFTATGLGGSAQTISMRSLDASNNVIGVGSGAYTPPATGSATANNQASLIVGVI